LLRRVRLSTGDMPHVVKLRAKLDKEVRGSPGLSGGGMPVRLLFCAQEEFVEATEKELGSKKQPDVS
jgi:hypothetical protein